jgi:quercetin dioxygenase-like cupin family protein
MLVKATTFLTLVAMLAGAAPAQAPVPPPVPVASLDVPQDKGAQEVQVVRRTFPVGSASGWHIHPGVEIAYVLSGVMALDTPGQPRRILRAGESFMMPRGGVHNGVNPGRRPAELLITYMLDKGVPARTSVPAP